MGATLTFRSIEAARFLLEMPCFIDFSVAVVSASLLAISGSLPFAKGTYRGQDRRQKILVPSNSMATIKSRKKSDGTIRHTAVIRIRKGTVVVYQESKTFAIRTAAKSWAKHREVTLEDPAELSRAMAEQTHVLDSYLLGKIIRWYIDTYRHVGKWGRTKQTTLEYLEHHPISDRDARYLTPSDLVQHVQERRSGGAGPATVGNDLTWLGVVLRAAKGAQGMKVNPTIVSEARTACRELRLIAKPRRRERRVTPLEERRLDDYFRRRDDRSQIPMFDIWHFAVESARREEEICNLLWEDIDAANRTGIVRDAKHPRSKEGNHRTFKMTAEAWAIVDRQPKTNVRIFPHKARSVSSAFTRACKILGIKDLRFHDGRHEATSRLFERGYQIHEVPQFTLHESWNELKRYTNLRPENVRDLSALPSKTNVIPFRPEQARRTPISFRPSPAVDQSTRRGPRRSRAKGISDHPNGIPDTAAVLPEPAASPRRD